MSECLQHTIIPFIDNKLTIMSDNEFVDEYLIRIRKLVEYLCLWQKGDMTYDRYFETRRNYKKDIKELKQQVILYKQRQTTKEQQSVNSIITQIEKKELRKIFGGDILTFDIPIP